MVRLEHNQSVTRRKMKPITDKAEVAIDFPDKAYIGAFGRHSGFEVSADAEGVTLKLSRPGDDSRTVPPGTKIPGGPPPGTVMRSELTLDFVKEKGGWKYDNQTFGMDPDHILACTSESFEPIEAYDEDKNTSLGGPIVRVAFNADHTLVVVRVLDEETCAFMPDRATLEKAGLNSSMLVPYAIVEIDGLPHRTNKQKVWVDHVRVTAE